MAAHQITQAQRSIHYSGNVGGRHLSEKDNQDRRIASIKDSWIKGTETVLEIELLRSRLGHATGALVILRGKALQYRARASRVTLR